MNDRKIIRTNTYPDDLNTSCFRISSKKEAVGNLFMFWLITGAFRGSLNFFTLFTNTLAPFFWMESLISISDTPPEAFFTTTTFLLRFLVFVSDGLVINSTMLQKYRNLSLYNLLIFKASLQHSRPLILITFPFIVPLFLWWIC